MKKFLLLIIVFMFMSGCIFSLQPQPSVCEKPEAEGSVICGMASRMGTTPETLDKIIRLATALKLDKDPTQAVKAMDYLEKLDKYLKGEIITYDGLAKILKGKPTTFVVSQEILDSFGGLKIAPDILMPISEFDQSLLRIHIEKQKQLLLVAIGD